MGWTLALTLYTSCVGKRIVYADGHGAATGHGNVTVYGHATKYLYGVDVSAGC